MLNQTHSLVRVPIIFPLTLNHGLITHSHILIIVTIIQWYCDSHILSTWEILSG
jgi:hypothetical protein